MDKILHADACDMHARRTYVSGESNGIWPVTQ